METIHRTYWRETETSNQPVECCTSCIPTHPQTLVMINLSGEYMSNEQASAIPCFSGVRVARRPVVWFITVLMSLLTSMAYALEIRPSADIRCIIIGMQMGNLADVSQRSAGSMLIMYHLGRLEIIAPELDVEESIVKELAVMTPRDFQSDSARCRRTLSDKAQSMVLIGKHLMDRGSKLSDKN